MSIVHKDNIQSALETEIKKTNFEIKTSIGLSILLLALGLFFIVLGVSVYDSLKMSDMMLGLVMACTIASGFVPLWWMYNDAKIKQSGAHNIRDEINKLP